MVRFPMFSLGLTAALMAVGCGSLEIVNPNAPDAKRALADPAGIEAVAGGTLRTWFNTEMGAANFGDGTLNLVTMADSYTSSWNSANMRIYSDTARVEWLNQAAAPQRTSIEAFWYGYYSALSSANDVMTAITKNNVVIFTPAETKMVQSVATLAQGLIYSEIALNYDKGFAVDENSIPGDHKFSNRKEMRDFALAKLDAVIALANANSFTLPAVWTNGTAYTNVQVAQIANTFAARTLAYYPRSAAENATVDWVRVGGYAAKGISSGTSFDFVFTGDGFHNFTNALVGQADDPTNLRVHTRVAHLLDPSTQQDPWPDAQNGNPQPNSPDKRLGDGTYGDAVLAANLSGKPQSGHGGTDFSWHSSQIFRASRGQYHQSNIAHIRYFYLGFSAPDGGGYGTSPVAITAETDLLLAEALIRGGGDLNAAAALINKTRVTRGGLSAASAADGVTGLLTKLQYEQDIELMGTGVQAFYNRRRIDGLRVRTPAEMPVPVKELNVLGLPTYTWGGVNNPAHSPTP